MKMMRYDSPWVASVGAAKKPTYKPNPASTAASAKNHGVNFPASGKNVCGDENQKRPGRELEAKTVLMVIQPKSEVLSPLPTESAPRRTMPTRPAKGNKR